MTPGPRVGRVVLLFVWLALFSFLYTAGEAFGLWPRLPAGAFPNVDLYVGAAGVAALCLWLARRRASP